MIIVRLMGGLGNQMFQYALLKSLEALGKEVYADDSWFQKFEAHNGLELDTIFPVRLNIADRMNVNKLGYADYSIVQRFLQKLFAKKTFITEKSSAICYDPTIFDLDNVYLSGYWQSEKYFFRVADDVKSIYRTIVVDNSSEYDNAIYNSESVSIHIRRGDYVNNPIHGGICDLKYYQKAVKYISNYIQNPKYFIFSNDIEWCKKNLRLDNVLFVQGNSGDKSYLDLRLMMMCKHNIIANSSFSWWGAYLNNNPDKIVITPDKWFNNWRGTADLIPSKWVKIST